MRLPLPVARKLCKQRIPIWSWRWSERRCRFTKLTELLCRKSSQWEDLNSVTVPHLRSRYIILEAKNCCSSDQRDAHGTTIKKAKGPDVTWVDEENES
ncbi:hypothetical protein MRX96_007621 [Rhipicephalus microplus]